MLTDKEVKDILNDLNSTLGCDNIVCERMDKAHEWLDVVLKAHMEITSNDFPHLLTIAKNYGFHINIYVYCLGQLGIFMRR